MFLRFQNQLWMDHSKIEITFTQQVRDWNNLKIDYQVGVI